MNPFGLSLSKPFDKLKANGYLDSLITRAESIGLPEEIAHQHVHGEHGHHH
jgi:hypothetical protein